MSQTARVARCTLGLVLACCLGAQGCSGSTYTDTTYSASTEAGAFAAGEGQQPEAGRSASDAGGSAPPAVAGTGSTSMPSKADAQCTTAVTSEHLRARSSTLATLANSHSTTSAAGVFTRDLFALFKSNCGGCHVDQTQGGLHIGSVADFAQRIDDMALQRIRSDDPKFYMPPAGMGAKAFSTRTADDPIIELSRLLEAWLAAGRPADVFYPASGMMSVQDDTRYLLDPDVGMNMTNVGNCVPAAAIISQQSTKTADLDKFFESATALPDRLEQTDLTTLDAAVLARDGVIAFAPGYPLWADNAKKIRMVRVPRGTSIAFDPETQHFQIPANTRFYKTFLKHVIDLDGNESYRKMETRLIVSRPDTINADGSRTPNALFGSYAWNEQETEAVLVKDPLRNGTPFRDRTFSYVLDEQAADGVIAQGPVNPGKALEDHKPSLTRTYAIPGSERCVQCHMGAPAASFILGFTPLQINRQPTGKSGVIETTGRDELNQLQRFIDYGLITGMAAPADAKLLEDSQGDRKPRNDYELKAQGYMLGNCSHCHNPFGFPSVSAPELRDVLNFLPGSSVGGIFQFPLDKVSPRILRGPDHSIPIAYITPSLYDLHDLIGSDTGDNFSTKTFTAKYPDGSELGGHYLYAPWRSLIYRNVDTPYTYVEDATIFPHMPRNTPGYDCRARQLLGTWMVSIPAAFSPAVFSANSKDPASNEYVATADIALPYVEVKPDDSAYDKAVRDAYYRVDDFTKSPRYTDCPSPDLDIVDPRIRDGAGDATFLVPQRQHTDNEKYNYDLNSPERAHWAVTDLTDAPGDWYPRRADWPDVLVTHTTQYRAGEEDLVRLLETIRVTGNDALHNYALTDIPMATWVEKPGCMFPAPIKTVGDFVAAERPDWMLPSMGNDPKPPAANAHVYSTSPGAYVFTSICQNCHGPEANAKSRNADTIADLTGGDTRVANLRDGLFGPAASPGTNRQHVFGMFAGNGLTADDWAGRYLSWMTLGGTQRNIPSAILSIVSTIPVYGLKRTGYTSTKKATANMLETVKALCRDILPQERGYYITATAERLTQHNTREPKYYNALVYANGDAAVWERLCTLQNPRPVRVLTARNNGTLELVVVPGNVDVPGSEPDYDLYARASYGTHPVGDQNAAVQPTLDDANTSPWCVREPDATLRASVDQAWAEKHPSGPGIPYCPAEVLGSARLHEDDILKWTSRGAMNAGLSVFLYLDALSKHTKERMPLYTECEKLSPK